jgi:hypothetical protein
MAFYQSPLQRLAYRNREQAPSHIGNVGVGGNSLKYSVKVHFSRYFYRASIEH